MKENNLSGNKPEQNGAEEKTKGFPIVTKQDEANADSFEVKKKNKDGDWIPATPVNITNSGATSKKTTEQPTEKLTDSEPVEKIQKEQATPVEKEKTVPFAQPVEEEPEQLEDEDLGYEEDEEVKNSFWASRKKRIAAIAAGVAAIVVIGFSTFVYTYGGIFPGVRVADDFKLRGMTQDEAQAYIAGEVQNGVFDRKLELVGKDLGTDTDKTYSIRLADVAQAVNSEAAAQQAYQIGREGNYFQRVGTVLNSMFTGWDVSLNVTLKDGTVVKKINEIADDLTYEPVQPSWEVKKEDKQLVIDTGKQGLTFDKEKATNDVMTKLQDVELETYVIETSAVAQQKPDAAVIAKDVNCEPKNASVDKKDGKTVLEAVTGVKVEESDIASKIGDASKQTYTIGVELTEAEIHKKDLEPVLFRDVLGSTTTYYNGGQTARTTNVRLAAQHCDGVILNPGEEFSYNDAVGPRTASRGFKSAIVFQDGQEVDGLGGGICQTSSTIYMAVLRADLKVSERHYHMFQVSYTPVSQDATVAWGSKDFRFVNDTKYPVKLDISCGGGALTVRILGTKTDDKQVSLYAKTSVRGNHKYAALYKTVTVDGKSETHKENSSSYKLK